MGCVSSKNATVESPEFDADASSSASTAAGRRNGSGHRLHSLYSLLAFGLPFEKIKEESKEENEGGPVKKIRKGAVMWFRELEVEEGVGGLETSEVTNDSFELQFPLIKFKNHQGVKEAELGTHTVRSHGVTVARTHMHDWLILMLLGVILAILNIIHPFYRFVGKDMMSDLKYPLKSNTVPEWLVPIYAVLLPVAVFLLFYVRRRDVYDLHHAILGILFSIFITGVLTDAIKDAVGRPRPDFFWRCFPDGKDAYDQWGNVVCHGDKSVIREGHKSFPSGHTSWSFAGLGFLSLYLSGKLKVFDRRGHVSKLCLVLLPLLVASLVGISRVDDYRHHWQDVFAGGLLGLVVATFCYLQFFPPPYHVDGWGTYAYLRILEESRSNVNYVQTSEAMVEIQQNERNNNADVGISLSGSPSLPVEDLEFGRR